MISRVISWPMLIIKACFSVGLVLLGMALFPWISIVGRPLTGLAATFGFAPAWPFHIVFNYSHLVSIPSFFWVLALVLFVPSCVALSRMDITSRRCFVKQVAICLCVIGFIPFVVFCAVYAQYGTALALNTPERERVVMSFVPIGAVGVMLLFESAVLGCMVKWLGKANAHTDRN